MFSAWAHRSADTESDRSGCANGEIPARPQESGRPPAALLPPPPALEVVLQRHLDLPRAADHVVLDAPERAAGQRRCGVAEGNRVRQIGRFRAKFQPVPFCNPESLQQRHVHVLQPWLLEAIPSHVAQRARRRNGELRDLVRGEVPDIPARWILERRSHRGTAPAAIRRARDDA